MTFLDYLMERKEQKDNKTVEWLTYKECCKKHWFENKEKIHNFFDNKESVFITYKQLETSIFSDIPKFYTLFPNTFSFCYYLDALGIPHKLVTKVNPFMPGSNAKESNGYLIYNPF